MSAFRDLVFEVIKQARSEKQLACLSHVYHDALGRCSQPTATAVVSTRREIEKEVLSNPKIQLAQVSEKQYDVSFNPTKAEESFSRFVSTRARKRGLLPDEILEWLIEGEFRDPTQDVCRKICKRHNIIELLTSSAGGRAPGALSCGQIVDSDWLYREVSADMVGRERDLSEHYAFLTLAGQSGQHYLLTGLPGTGKSLFVKSLIKHTLEQWKSHTDPRLRKAQFLFVQDTVFCGSEDEALDRLRNLYDYLNDHQEVIPVFDGFEMLLKETLPISGHFTQQFGGIIEGRTRTFVLVTRTDQAGASGLLKGIRPSPLPVMTVEATKPIVSVRIEQEVKVAPIQLSIEGGAGSFADEILNLTSERYPGRHLPQVALDLARSAVHRACARIMRDGDLAIESGDLKITDLREHVAKEQNLSAEVIGKDPDEFYAALAETLKKDVIGQDHAVDRICRVLALKATGPSRKMPRGRFLFVGPPGVGKTHLGRSLALRLGYGEEAFFVYNMSNFGSDGDRWRFMGSPVGYEGHGQMRTIFDEVRDRPSCVILLDEIDRAHSAIQDILLSMLEGEAKDGMNERTHFSQAIFIMTTNHGQDQVTGAYKRRAAESSRADLAREFSDEKLRTLILEGILDVDELTMRKQIDEEIKNFKSGLGVAFKGAEGSASTGAAGIQHYINLKRLKEDLQHTQYRTALDRAFLDRVDFIIPFFPIKERENVAKILDLKLKDVGWADCPQGVKDMILDDSSGEDESVRALPRLIEKAQTDRMSWGA